MDEVKVTDSNESDALGRMPPPPPGACPRWLLDNCVRTLTALEASGRKLIVNSSDSVEQTEEEVKPDDDAVCTIDESVYGPLLDIYNPDFESKTLDAEQTTGASNGNAFAYGAALLMFPGKYNWKASEQFFRTVVDQFATDAKAVLVTLSCDDMKDLKEWQLGWGPIDGVERVLVNAIPDEDDPDDNPEGQIKPPPFSIPFAALSKWSGSDVEGPQEGQQHTKNQPIVVHIQQINEVLHELGSKDLSSICSSVPENGIVLMSESGQLSRSAYDFNFVFENPSRCEILLDALASGAARPRRLPIYLAPQSNSVQRELLEKHVAMEASYLRGNIRLLQRYFRRVSPKHWDMSVVQPYASWKFLKGTDTKKSLKTAVLDESEAKDVAYTLHASGSEEEIRTAVSRMGRRRMALSPWLASVEIIDVGEDKWSSFPEHIQKTLRKVEGASNGLGPPSKYEWESRLLDNLVDPLTMEDSWSDIALNPDVKDSIQRLVNQASTARLTPAYGILKRSKVGGALLYGPPGTGKTHLARVLAKESASTMISISSADLVHCYLGESEKAIKGLFSLGRMLSPCIIFIDEADALFRPRSEQDRGWERNQTNQLLHEMDGLEKHKESPFVLLATNYPNQVDYALLRRVTSRIHIGLPTRKARLEIWKICLREEILSPDIDYAVLVHRSRGYSGSDIQTVCVQAALRCSVFDEDGKRLLSMSDLGGALKRCAPSVSKNALAEIAAFANEFDPLAKSKYGTTSKLES